ncbi:tetratricopeptide repeat protein [Rhodospirillaceae bacterium]|nr:tetratricopeptide repeat protein [Rhodospirillaceae bacterium]
MELTIDQALQKGIAAHKEGKLQEAENLYRAILNAQPTHPDANHNLGILALTVDKISEALPHFKIAVESNPAIEQFWLSYIDALIQLNQMVIARQALKQRKDVGLESDKFIHLERQMVEKEVIDQSNNGINYPKQGQLDTLILLYNQGNMQKALSRGNELENQFPKSPEVQNILGVVHFNLVNYDKAIDNYKKAIQIKPSFAEAYNNIGAAYRKISKHRLAILSYKRAIEIMPKYPEAHNNLGVALNDTGDLQASIINYEKAIQLNSNYAEAYNNLGVVLNDIGHFQDAIASYKKAIDIEPHYAEALYNLGLLHHEAENYEEAIKYLEMTDFGKSKYHLLRSLYYAQKASRFYELLDKFIGSCKVDPIIGSFVSRSELRFGKERKNLFCKDPLEYVFKTDLRKNYDFDCLFIKVARTIMNENNLAKRKQSLLKNGYQTHGNLFDLYGDLTKGLRKVLHSEIESYLINFKDSKEGLIKHWPSHYRLNGWLINMKSGGGIKATYA